MSKICGVALDARHNPTGRRIFCGFDGRMDKPLRVEVMRYRPEPLYFLRLHYKNYALRCRAKKTYRNVSVPSDGFHSSIRRGMRLF